MARVDIIHGPNLNLLGEREPEIYGRATLAEINDALVAAGKARGVEVRFFQSNHEGALIDHIQEAGREADALIINPGAYTHTSIAIRDAVAALSIPVIEVHLSNTQRRERFRRRSFIADVVTGRIEGLGRAGYDLALEYVLDQIQEKK
ncbi:type II 3-dehydroquinate dehydratase [bacterium]|nr:type II 3-dehydroquinate dehydratase [bacterium]